MQRFKNILVLYSQRIGDEAALDRAAALAKRNSARLTVLEVFERLPSHALATLTASAASGRDVEQRFVDERQAHLNRLIASIRPEGIDVRAVIRRGPAFLEVIRKVLRDGHDLVILTADSWQGLRAITFGSTSMHVMRKCPCPVWVINPGAGRRFRRILAAVDPNIADESPDPLDLKIMQMASSLARMEGCSLDVVNAWDFTGADLDTSRSEITDEIRDRLVERNESAHRAVLDRLLGAVDLGGVPVEVHLPRGDARVAIPALVEERQTDLIVMGTVTRTGIAGFLIGETAEDVLRQVDCSVLTVKPDGFQTPVALDD